MIGPMADVRITISVNGLPAGDLHRTLTVDGGPHPTVAAVNGLDALGRVVHHAITQTAPVPMLNAGRHHEAPTEYIQRVR